MKGNIMKYSIDYEEEKKGFQIVKDIEKVIEEAKEDFRYGSINYGEMLYKIGEKMKIAGCALAEENRYADKKDEENFIDEIENQEIRDWVNY